MLFSFRLWLVAFSLAVGLHIALTHLFHKNESVKIERASGPQITVIGSKVFSEIEKEKENTVDSEKSEKAEEKQEEKVIQEKPEPKKEITKPQEVKLPVVKKTEVKPVKPEPVQEAVPLPQKPKISEPVKKEIPLKKKKEVVKKPEPKKKKAKKVQNKTPKKKVKKTKRTKNKKKSVSSQRSGRRTAATNTGGGQRGRQNTISGRAAITNYKGQIISHLGRYKRFPKEARDRGDRGKVIIRFSISSSGKVLSVKLVRGSGIRILDKAALNTVRRASPFPPIPKGMNRRLTFTVPINYDIR